MKIIIVSLLVCVMISALFAQSGSAAAARVKPGSCARGGRSSGISSSGGSQGGNGIGVGVGGSHGGNGVPSTQRCSNDYNCSGNKKCCSGSCATPSFSG